jgi:hypothetical protein
VKYNDNDVVDCTCLQNRLEEELESDMIDAPNRTLNMEHNANKETENC